MIVDHKLATVFAAVLDGERPDVGVVGRPSPKKFVGLSSPASPCR